MRTRLLELAFGLSLAGLTLRVGLWAAQLYETTWLAVAGLYLAAIVAGTILLNRTGGERGRVARGESALAYLSIVPTILAFNISLLHAGPPGRDLALASLAAGPAVLFLYAVLVSAVRP